MLRPGKYVATVSSVERFSTDRGEWLRTTFDVQSEIAKTPAPRRKARPRRVPWCHSCRRPDAECACQPEGGW